MVSRTEPLAPRPVNLKMAPRTLAIFSDSPHFGGHEIAFLGLFPALLNSDQIRSVHFLAPASNTKLLAALKELDHPRLHIHETPFEKAGAEPFRAPLRLGFGLAVRKFVRYVKADIALLLQGRVENLATPMLWLPRDVEVVSYIPMAHSDRLMGKPKLVAMLTDGVKRFYYGRPQRLITVSRAVEQQLRTAGARGEIHVVENVVKPPSYPPPPKSEARSALVLPQDLKIATYIGRFDTFQKGLDRLADALERESAELGDWYFCFVGDGPAAARLQALISNGQIRGRVVPWTAHPQTFLAASDVLLLPSRYEGVPLILLEALSSRLPVLASRIDVFEEYLAPDMLHTFEEGGLAIAMAQLLSSDCLARYDARAADILARISLPKSQTKFVDAVLGQTPNRAKVQKHSDYQ